MTTRLFWKGLGLPHQFFENSNPLQRKNLCCYSSWITVKLRNYWETSPTPTPTATPTPTRICCCWGWVAVYWWLAVAKLQIWAVRRQLLHNSWGTCRHVWVSNPYSQAGKFEKTNIFLGPGRGAFLPVDPFDDLSSTALPLRNESLGGCQTRPANICRPAIEQQCSQPWVHWHAMWESWSQGWSGDLFISLSLLRLTLFQIFLPRIWTTSVRDWKNTSATWWKWSCSNRYDSFDTNKLGIDPEVSYQQMTLQERVCDSHVRTAQSQEIFGKVGCQVVFRWQSKVQVEITYWSWKGYLSSQMKNPSGLFNRKHKGTNIPNKIKHGGSSCGTMKIPLKNIQLPMVPRHDSEAMIGMA